MSVCIHIQTYIMSKQNTYYAVACGLSTGVFCNWDEVKDLVTEYPGADYKKFTNEEEAFLYIKEYNTKHLIIQSNKNKIESKLDTLNEEQLAVIEHLLSGENLMLTGGAGCGKSYLISVIYHELSQLRKERLGKGLRVQLCAMTGCAAILLGNRAKTVHSWAGIGLGKGTISELLMKVKRNRKAFKNWLCTDLLVIDEISMMTDELFTKMNNLAKKIRGNTRPFGGMQLLLVGDFFQLPPVSKNIVLEDGTEIKNKFIFESDAWKEVIGTNVVDLKEIHRQKDPVFQKILTETRYGTLSAESIEILKSRMGISWNEFKIKPTLIFPRRSEVEMINDMNLSALSGKKHTFKATIVYDGKSPQGFNARDERFLETVQKLDGDAPYLADLELAVDAQVMLITNLNQEAGLVNGSRGVLSYFCGVTGLPVVEFTNGLKMTIGNATWEIDDYPGVMRSQIPLRLAYAITNHKSQGISLDSALIDIGPGIFEYGQAYVALSRCRTLEGLYIHDFEPTSIKAHQRVKEFYKSIESLKK